jgi:hypothetical protein
MEREILNNKDAYSACGIVAGKALSKLGKKYNHDDAQTVLKAVSVQMRVNEIEVKIANARVNVDEHNKKYNTHLSLRNVENGQFGY